MNTATAHILDTYVAPAAPRLGFIGTGWIGRMRMEALLNEHIADCCTVYDPSPTAATEAAALQHGIRVSKSLTDILAQDDLDGVVIATPSALHADHCIAALEAGKAVFCQKPLARTCEETQRVVDAARAANRLLGVDFSYRYLAGVDTLKHKIFTGELGEIYAADLVFHNAYGPDKSWFYDVSSAGGGCVMDLGIHLVDLANYLLGNRVIRQVSSNLFHKGKSISPPYGVVEDYATAEFMHGRTRTRLTCSWNLHAGRDAVIEASFYGTHGGASITNVNGSFYDFEVHQFSGTSREKLAGYPDAWGGRALIDWAKNLSHSNTFDPDVEQAIQVADVIDRIYCR
ncbi:MAG TPA: Gfo/Idh/MocA family oxidoreductase [Cellvibrio sp.]|nr:Gfo/Idh/MocA family oxidoreductase [Cellvibrio sp.]